MKYIQIKSEPMHKSANLGKPTPSPCKKIVKWAGVNHYADCSFISYDAGVCNCPLKKLNRPNNQPKQGEDVCRIPNCKDCQPTEKDTVKPKPVTVKSSVKGWEEDLDHILEMLDSGVYSHSKARRLIGNL